MGMKALWCTWGVVALALSAYFSLALFADPKPGAAIPLPAKTMFLPHPTTPGHFQIENQCSLCHTPFLGVRQEACLDCHQEDLDLAQDTHAPRVFTEKHAHQLEKMDVRACTSCHTEHQPGITGPGGVTVSDRFCAQCHARIRQTSATHVDLSFDMCVGCHNYHDNTALTYDFLRANQDMPDLLPDAKVPQRAEAPRAAAAAAPAPLSKADADAPAARQFPAQIVTQWEQSAHAMGGVNCTACHQQDNNRNESTAWQDHLTHAQCASCHAEQVGEFLKSRKGMRLAQGLPAMTPGQSRLPMHATAHDQELQCTSCHGAHEENPRHAAVDACLGCHDSQHTNAYQGSAHYRLWLAEIEGRAAPGSGVSCATCHLPREVAGSAENAAIRVHHNVNRDLRPNEKMVRTVCMHCHGAKFSLQALADPRQVSNNFQAPPIPRKFSIERHLQEKSASSPGR